MADPDRKSRHLDERASWAATDTGTHAAHRRVSARRVRASKARKYQSCMLYCRPATLVLIEEDG